MTNRQVDVDLGSVPAEEEYNANLVIVLGDQERRESVFLGDACCTFGTDEVREVIQF